MSRSRPKGAGGSRNNARAVEHESSLPADRPSQKDDIGKIRLYIAQDDPTAADRFVSRLLERCLQLGEHPGTGRKREELVPGLRSAVVGSYPISCHATEECIDIVRVISGHRDIEALFESS